MQRRIRLSEEELRLRREETRKIILHYLAMRQGRHEVVEKAIEKRAEDIEKRVWERVARTSEGDSPILPNDLSKNQP